MMVSQLDKTFDSIMSDTEIKTGAEKKPILVIDDNQEVIDALEMVLGRDYTLLTCRSYRECIHKITSQIKLVILDIKMAYKDGIEVFSLLKEKDPNLKIIFHSAYPGNNEEAIKAEALPHSGYLTKGAYDITELLLLVKNLT